MNIFQYKVQKFNESFYIFGYLLEPLVAFWPLIENPKAKFKQINLIFY
jgi:hypothetical protein